MFFFYSQKSDRISAVNLNLRVLLALFSNHVCDFYYTQKKQSFVVKRVNTLGVNAKLTFNRNLSLFVA